MLINSICIMMHTSIHPIRGINMRCINNIVVAQYAYIVYSVFPVPLYSICLLLTCESNSTTVAVADSMAHLFHVLVFRIPYTLVNQAK